MRVVVFAHVPPPHHGQSFMVKQLVDGLEQADSDIEIFHVDARISKSIDDMGGGGIGKVVKLVRYSLRAIWLRLAKGADTFYYVPAPPKRATLYRDWIVMALCRPFFKNIVFHWHAVGLGEWIDGRAETPVAPKGWEKFLTGRLLGRVELSLPLSGYNRADAEVFDPKNVVVVPNGIPDPCADFAEIQKKREAGARDGVLRVLYLGHCTEDKGLFDAVAAVKLANAAGADVRLTVAGEFIDKGERERFDEMVAGESAIDYIGFVGGDAKIAALCDHDCLCFPTFYSAESFGLVLVEAMAFGLIPIASDWRTVGELARRAGLEPVPPRSPDALAGALMELVRQPPSAGDRERLRQHFLEHYGIGSHLEQMARALKSL